MAFKLTSKESNRRDEIAEDLRTRQELFENTKGVDPTPQDIENLQLKLAEFLVVLAEAEEFREEIAGRLRDEFETKSEKWMESDKGQEVAEFIDEWEQADFTEPSLEDPQELELEDYSEVLGNLPEGA